MILELAVACAFIGSGDYIRPDHSCTPGDYDHAIDSMPGREARTYVCKVEPRDEATRATRIRVFNAYGVSHVNGYRFDGEADHLVPAWATGKGTFANIWPEAGPRPNPKDDLENYAYERVCEKKNLTVKTMMSWWRNWPQYYKRYKNDL